MAGSKNPSHNNQGQKYVVIHKDALWPIGVVFWVRRVLRRGAGGNGRRLGGINSPGKKIYRNTEKKEIPNGERGRIRPAGHILFFMAQ